VVRLIVATTNRGKLAEFKRLLEGLELDVVSIGEVVPQAPTVAEDGATFAENALKKARAAAQAAGALALADDSGIEVDALGGRPGVRSARFAGEHATDAENNALLLGELARCGQAAPFGARFRCVLALCAPDDGPEGASLVEGCCEGFITSLPRGRWGFGYDPIFEPAGQSKTMAELSAEEKDQVSHRARAIMALRPVLRARLAGVRNG
jgi:XTP/dITP diphosphohydrolase